LRRRAGLRYVPEKGGRTISGGEPTFYEYEKP